MGDRGDDWEGREEKGKKRMIRAVLRGGMGCWLVGRMARLVVRKGGACDSAGPRADGMSGGRR